MTVLNCHKDRIPEDAIWIMRPSKWGNPYKIDRDNTREAVIEKYKRYVLKQLREGRITMRDLAELHGKTLVCCCTPKPCHGHVLELAAEWAHKRLNHAGEGPSNGDAV